MAHLKDLIVNGASRFIGKAYGAFVGSFSGNLDGNATTSTTANTAKACSGNSATATKLQTSRTLSLSGKAAGSTTFDGSANAAINVTSVNADTASKLSTARRINITGNASGAATFDGSGDININTTVNESKHAVNADSATKVNATAPDGGTADLVFGTMTVNDYARVRVGGSDDNGWLEIATADNGNEPIYARQYSGGRDWPEGRPGTVTNEAAILDSNGNTKFPHDVTAANFVGHLTGNADSATNADKVDGYHENSFLRYRGAADATGENTLWDQIGIKEYNNVLPESLTGTYTYGAVISLPSSNNRLDLWYDCYASNTGTGLYYRTGWQNDKKAWARLLDSNNYTNWSPTKTGSGASGTWDISITGNANTASTASSVPWDGVTGKPGTYPPSAHNHDSAYPSVTGTRASGTWGINISGNAASATTATTATKANGLTGSLNFPDIGDVATSNKISWNGSTNGADIYYQTTASDQGNLVLNLRDDANCYLRIAYNGEFKSFFSPADGNFHGNVNGKADTAGTADTAKACSGNAATATKATSATTAATCTGNSATATKATTALNIPTSDVGGNIWIA